MRKKTNTGVRFLVHHRVVKSITAAHLCCAYSMLDLDVALVTCVQREACMVTLCWIIGQSCTLVTNWTVCIVCASRVFTALKWNRSYELHIGAPRQNPSTSSLFPPLPLHPFRLPASPLPLPPLLKK